MRIDKYLANTLEYSRSDIKKYMKQGRVKINDEVIKDSGYNVLESDIVTFKGEVIEYNKYKYFVMNKPQGVVSATKDNFDRTVIDLLNESHKKMELFPVGRLDKDTEGLLILTNDGEFAHNSLSPKKHVDKKYYVHVDGLLTDENIKAFFEGVIIDKVVKLKSSKLEIIEASDELSKCFVTISEGKFHQIKKMFLTQDKKVVYLKRVGFGKFDLPDDIETGNYRELTEIERKILLGEINE